MVDDFLLMIEMIKKTISDVDEITATYRLDWSDFDGRDLRRDIDGTLKELRELLGNRCPTCGSKLQGRSGLEYMPAGNYCPKCNDAIYDDKGEVLCRLV